MEQINWKDLLEQADKAGTPPQAGVPLTCRCAAAKWKGSSTGKVGFNLRWQVIAGPDEGKTFFDNLWVSEDNPTAMLMTFNKMRAIGVDPATLQQVPQEQQPQLFIGKLSNIIVSTDREWGNSKQIDVQSYAPAAGGVAAVAPPPVAVAPPPVAAPPVAAPPVAPAPAPVAVPQPVAPAPAPAPIAPAPAPVAVPQPVAAPVAVPAPVTTPVPVAPAAPAVAPVAAPVVAPAPPVAPVAQPAAVPPAPAVAEQPVAAPPPAAPAAPAAPSVAGAVPAPPEVFGQ